MKEREVIDMRFDVLQIRKSSYDSVSYYGKDFDKKSFDINDYFCFSSSVVEAKSTEEALNKIINLFNEKANSKMLAHAITTSDIIMLDGRVLYKNNNEWVDITEMATPQLNKNLETLFDNSYVVYMGHYWG